jgi:hypothetical protein
VNEPCGYTRGCGVSAKRCHTITVGAYAKNPDSKPAVTPSEIRQPLPDPAGVTTDLPYARAFPGLLDDLAVTPSVAGRTTTGKCPAATT